MLSTARRSFLTCRPATASSRFASARHFQTTCRRFKDEADRESLTPQSNEYSKSGSDQQAAATEKAAFDPDKTSPESEYKSAGKEAGGEDQKNPLNVSPAHQEISRPNDPQTGGAQGSPAETGQGKSERSGQSGGGSAPKGGKV